MFTSLCRLCTGESLEISPNDDEDMNIGTNGVDDNEMAMMNGGRDNETTATAIMLHNDIDDDDDDDDNVLAVKTNLKKNKSKPNKMDKGMKIKLKQQQKQANRINHARTAAFIVTSSIYGQLLVVVCIALFTAQTVTPQIPLYYFEAFYLYLYSASLLFLLYVYIYLLNDAPKPEPSRIRQFDSKFSSQTMNSGNNNKTSETDRSHASIFLRIGSVVFGLGVMIYNGLEFGAYFEIPYESPCYSVLLGVNPLLQATFTFGQMHFIFVNSRLMINKFKLIARIGLMHLVGTNICVWIRTLGKETLHELKNNAVNFGLNRTNKLTTWENQTLWTSETSPLTMTTMVTNGTANLNSLCQKESIMGSILQNASPYLFPFIVEESLIAAAFLWCMWSSIGKRYTASVYEENSLSSVSCHQVVGSPITNDGISASSRTSSMQNLPALYSCLGSSKGLFTGFFFLAISVTSLIIFFVLVHHPNYSVMASLLSDISHSVLLVLSSVAILVGFIKTSKLKFQPVRETADANLRDLLLRIAAFGLYAYSLFGVIAGAMKLDSTQHVFVLVTNLLTIVQVTLQTLFISDVVCRKRSGQKQPGRQLITFLLINNLTLWILYTFEMQKLEASPIQLSVYGFTTWALILRITLPLSIFYRFHSAITFAEVWKNSYKPSTA